MSDSQESALKRMMRTLGEVRQRMKAAGIKWHLCSCISFVRNKEEQVFIVSYNHLSKELVFHIYRMQDYQNMLGMHGGIWIEKDVNPLNTREDVFFPHLEVCFVGRNQTDPMQREIFTKIRTEQGMKVSGTLAYPRVSYLDGCHAPTTELTEQMMDTVREDIETYFDILEKHAVPLDSYALYGGRMLRVKLPVPEGRLQTEDFPKATFLIREPDLSRLEEDRLKGLGELPHQGDFFATLYPVDQLLQVEPESQEAYPYVFYMGQVGSVDTESMDPGDSLFFPLLHPEKNEEGILERLMEYFEGRGYASKTIHVGNPYAKALLEAFCHRCQIRFAEDGEEDPVDFFLEEYVKALAENQQMEKLGERSLTIRVSLDKSVYRDIRISVYESFESLASAILQAYGFDRDHLFCFEVTRRGKADEILGGFWVDDEDYRQASQTRLWEVDLENGTSFRCLYDFGDRWRFSCKVRKVWEEGTEGGWQIVGVKGESPDQYAW